MAKKDAPVRRYLVPGAADYAEVLASRKPRVPAKSFTLSRKQLQDIIERAKESRSAMELRRNLDRLNLPFIIARLDGTIEHANQKAPGSFGLRRKNVVHQQIGSIFSGPEFTELWETARQNASSLAPGESRILEPALVMRDDPSGEKIESIARVTVARPRDGSDPKVMASITHTRRVLEQSHLLRDFFGMADRIHSQRELDTLLQDIVTHFSHQFGASAMIVRPDPADGSKLQLAAFSGNPRTPGKITSAQFLGFNNVPVGTGLLGKVAQEMRSIEVDDMRTWPHSYQRELDDRFGFGHAIGVPLTVQGTDGKPILVGVLGLYKHGGSKQQRFRPHERQMLQLLARNTATSIHNAKLTEELRRAAEEDQLTGLYNRRVLFRTMRDYLNSHPPGHHSFEPALEGKKGSVIFADANNLKLANDRHGHNVGDNGLVKVGEALKEAVKGIPGAVVSRVGGDEFAAFIPEVDLPETERIKERFQDAVARKIGTDPRLVETQFGASADFIHFGAGGTSRSEYANLHEVIERFKHPGSPEPIDEHGFFDELLHLAAVRMQAAKTSTRGQEFVHAPTLLQDLPGLRLPRRHEDAVLALLEKHAGKTVVDAYRQRARPATERSAGARERRRR